MNAAWTSAIIAAVGVLVSILMSAFVSGRRWGHVETALKQLQDDRDERVTTTDLQAVIDRLTRIEQMFTLRLAKQRRKW